MKDNVIVVGDPNKDLKITNYVDWVKLHFNKLEESEEDFERQECEIVENIIALQVSYYLLRRTGYICGSLVI